MVRHTATAQSPARPAWNVDRHLALSQGDSVTLQCVTSHVTQRDVSTVSRVVEGAQTLTLSDNGLLRAPFNSMLRYRVEHRHSAGTTTITLHIEGQ